MLLRSSSVAACSDVCARHSLADQAAAQPSAREPTLQRCWNRSQGKATLKLPCDVDVLFEPLAGSCWARPAQNFILCSYFRFHFQRKTTKSSTIF